MDVHEARQSSTWQNAVVYQIYPWTFAEDSGREPQLGHGSIRGIEERLSYLESLGVNAIWLSPFYPSPMVDGGYDIADFKNVHPALGTLEDFDSLVKAAHAKHIRLMVDFIPNHSSDKHEWFEKSRRQEDGYDDWYIWHPGSVDEHGEHQPPNNWASVFSIPNRKARERGEMHWLHEQEWTPPISAWKWDDVRQEFYMHSFAVEQPDLNWSNPYVREAMKDAMRFWLDRGVDGFRVDAINHIGKNMELPDEEVNTAYNEEWYENPYDQLQKFQSCNYPRTLHEYIWEMCQVLKDEVYEHRDLRMILEAYMGESDLRDIDAIAPEVASTFNFGGLLASWDAGSRKIQMDYYYERLLRDAVANQVNGNHDKPRLASRLGDNGARAAAVLNLFLPGMRFIYNGEELGLVDAEIPSWRLQDPNGLRDPERTPIPWDDTLPNAGFSNADPKDLWLPANQADAHKAVMRQKQHDTSSLSLYRAAIRLTHELPSAQNGKYVPLHTDNDQVMAYGREDEGTGDQLIVLVNFSRDKQGSVRVSDSHFVIGEQVLSSISVEQSSHRVDVRAGVALEPDEVSVIKKL